MGGALKEHTAEFLALGFFYGVRVWDPSILVAAPGS